MRPLNRRTVLRGLLRGAAVSVALPPLEAFFNTSGTAWACGGPIPRRFGLFFWGNGNIPDRWVPPDEGPGFTLSDQLAPLAPVRDKIAVLTGLNVKVPNVHPHGSGAAGVLSGAAPTDGNDSTFSLPSIDQVIAAEIGRDSVYPSIQTAATNILGLSYNGPNSRNPAIASPYELFERIFGAGFREPGEGGVVDPSLGLRRSVLDVVMDDAARVRGRLGAADQVRLDDHLDGVRQLEQRLARLQEDPPDLASCSRPGAPLESYPDVDGRPQLSAVNRAMSDLLAMAFACDQTRVFAHFLTEPVSDALFPGASTGHHLLTHNEPGSQPEVHEITVQVMEELAYLIARLDSIPEGDGTVLDHMALMATSEVSLGRTHSIDDIPLIVAGSCCGALRTGFHARSLSGESASKVHFSILRALGVSVTSFGQGDARVTGGLSALDA